MAWLREQKAGRLIFIMTLVVILGYIFYLVRGLVLSFALAALITYLLNPLVNAIEKKGTPRIGAILLAYLALFFPAAGIFMYGIPRIVEQLNRLSDTIPLYTGQAHEIAQAIQNRYSDLGIPDGMRQIFDERLHWFEENILQLFRRMVNVLIGTVGYVFKIMLAPVLSFYILKDLEFIKNKAVLVLPVEWRAEAFELIKEINQVLSSFIRGYLLVAAVVGGLTAVTMALLGVEFALMLGIFAGLAELIPYFGPVIGALPAVGLAVLKSKWLAAKVALAFLIIHQLEGNIISPKILGDKVGLHPLVVIFSLLAGGELYGLAGMLLAVPVAAVLRVVLKFIYLKMFL